jgi:multidrug efflux system membrane fusion protein
MPANCSINAPPFPSQDLLKMNIHDAMTVAAKRTRRFALPALGLLAVAVLAACSSQADPGEAAAMPAPEVSVAEVLSRPVAEWDGFTGRVQAAETVELRPRVSGYVERVAYREGGEVNKGDLLFVIDQRPYRTALASAQAQLARARSEAQLTLTQANRASELLAASAISREESETRRAASTQAASSVRAAEAAVQAAQLDLTFTEVRAPISGRAGRALVTAGNLAQADGTLLTTLVSMDPVHVYFETDEQTYLRYNQLTRDGDRAASRNAVRVGLSNEQGYPHEGTVDFIDNRVEAGTGTIRARAVLANPDRVFTPGLFARVQIEGGNATTAMLVDDKAVLTDQDRKYVYVLGADNTAQRKDVTVGRVVDGLRVVQSGLEAGDKVIVNGVQKVFFPGMPVNAKPVAMTGAARAPETAVASK